MIRFSFMLICLGSSLTWAQDSDEDKPAKIEIKFADEAEATNEGDIQPVERLFKNPALAQGLVSGADAINRSIESLMDALFYSLLDNELHYNLNDYAFFAVGLNREVFSAPSGAYVVVDRMTLGPRYSRELWRAQDIPINLGADGSVEVLQIDLRTDGQRLVESEKLSTWGWLVKNWFGLLPLASSILPPSFNPNELYDPMRQLKTPFVFPLEDETFYEMPIGSIRSYLISGGVALAPDFAGPIKTNAQDQLEDIGSLVPQLPYTVFKRGEHRINVLRRRQHIAWVGVSEVDRIGHSLSPVLGNTLFVLRGALGVNFFDWTWRWSGLPATLFPISVEGTQALADLYDQVYEFDLRNPHGIEAYEAAVAGNFAVARSRYLLQKEQGIETGVIFHFSRDQQRREIEVENTPNLAVARAERKQQRFAAEIEITDQDGRFHVLEGRQNIQDRWLDVLVGEEKQEHSQVVELKVRKVLVEGEAKDGDEDFIGPPSPENLNRGDDVGGDDVDGLEFGQADDAEDHDQEADGAKEKEKEYTYIFAVDEEPTRLTLAFNIQDRYLDAEEYLRYLQSLRYFSSLALEDVPKIPFRDKVWQQERRQRAFFDTPSSQVVSLHITPTYLGRFSAQAVISFPHAELTKVLETEEEDQWRAFARAFGVDEDQWADPEHRDSLLHQSRWFGAFLLYPLRLFNIRFPVVDAIGEISRGVGALQSIISLPTPLQKLDAFYKLFETDYPMIVARALMNLSDLEMIPRKVTFQAQPKGSARHEVKRKYRKLDRKVFQSRLPLPPPNRYGRAKKKMAAFFIDRPREDTGKPKLTRIEVSTKGVPLSIRSVPPGDGKGGQLRNRDSQVFIKIETRLMSSDLPGKVYVRVEQAGRIKFGKLELAEKVLDLTPTSADKGSQSYSFYLTGPLSSLSNFAFDSAVATGDDFLVTISVSREGDVWSDERSLEFRFENGKLLPIDD